jgi:multisubunit Na+/H+ antiporter MnhE subunit
MSRLNSFTLSAILLATFVPHLLLINYSLFSLEVGFFVALCVFFGFVIGHFVKNKYIFGFILGFCIYFFLDAYFLSGNLAGLCLIVCVFYTPLLLRYIQSAIQLSVLAFSVVFLLPTLFKVPDAVVVTREATRDASIVADAPDLAYIHIILDEQKSPFVTEEMMPHDYTAKKFLNSYLMNDFKVYGVARSNSSHTFESVSAIFGLTNERDNYEQNIPGEDYSYEVSNNRLVGKLSELGFSTTVIESSFLGLCGNNSAITCQTYSRVSNMQALENLGLSYGQRLKFAFLNLYDDYLFQSKRVLLLQYVAVSMSKAQSEEMPKPYDYFARAIVNVNILRNMAELTKDIDPGEAIIAHILLPHFPFVLNSDCTLGRPSQWGYPLRHDTVVDLEKTYATYWDQAICTNNLISEILEQVKARDDVVIIVHGDHGARLFRETEFENNADNLDTFLAVKSPILDGGLSVSPVSLQQTFARSFDAALGYSLED